MKRIKVALSIFSVLAFVAISSSAFAAVGFGEEPNWDVTPSAKALAAASSASYNQDYLNAVISDAGADIIPSAKAVAAALFYEYNEAKVAAGVEDAAENLYFASEHQSADIKAIVNHASSDSLLCQSC